MLSSVHTFLHTHHASERPLLLGFSGGPDSVALLHLLLDCRKSHPLNLHLAHIDHGWRSESGQEAQELQQMAEQLGLPFHLKRLDPEALKGNLEAACRHERLAFFAELTSRFQFQAVLLAHHADDQSETVLKAILEGKSLPYLTGMSAVSAFEGLSIWRPLLPFPKAVIEGYLESKGLHAIQDRTNVDPRFLRARMRTQIIPALSASFGKEVSGSLYRLAAEAQELHGYLDDRIAPYLDKIREGPWGIYLDLSDEAFPASAIEVRTLIKRMAERQGMVLSREIVETLVSLLQQNSADRQVSMGHRTLWVDRRRLFFLKESLPKLPEEPQPLVEGEQWYGSWKITVHVQQTHAKTSLASWKETMGGEFTIIVPKAEYIIGNMSKEMNKWLTNHKIPAFLRNSVPALWMDGRPVYEFLTGCEKVRLSIGQMVMISFVHK